MAECIGCSSGGRDSVLCATCGRKWVVEPEFVWVVKVCDCEITSIKSLHYTHEDALAGFHRERLDLIKEYQRMIDVYDEHIALPHENSVDLFERFREECAERGIATVEEMEAERKRDREEMYQEMIDNLLEEDPEKIDNYPHSVPVIRKYRVGERYEF